MTVLGLETGLLLHVMASAAGRAAVVSSSVPTLTVIKLAGASFLLYLGVAEFRHASTTIRETAQARLVGLALLCDGTSAPLAGRLAVRLRTSARSRTLLARVTGVVYISLGGFVLLTWGPFWRPAAQAPHTRARQRQEDNPRKPDRARGIARGNVRYSPRR